MQTIVYTTKDRKCFISVEVAAIGDKAIIWVHNEDEIAHLFLTASELAHFIALAGKTLADLTK